MSDVAHRLRAFSEAYPDDIFTPLTPDEVAAHPVVVTRASAAMGRHFAKVFREAADEIEHLKRQLGLCGYEAYRILERTDPPDLDYFNAEMITRIAEQDAADYIDRPSDSQDVRHE